MKKLLMFSVVFSFMFASKAQRLKEAEVPVAVRSAFQKQYPDTPEKWEREKANYEVNFKKDGKAMSAVIDRRGTIIETETDIPVNELPQTAQSYFKAHYKDVKIKEAAKIVKANGEVNYEGEVNNKDVIFDSNGKFIKEAKD